MNVSTIAKRWRALSGQDNWKNLLNPLDIDLRRYLIHYGERAQVCYDTFIFNPLSAFAGCSTYRKEDLFSKVGLEKANPFKYTVTKYLYATSSLEFPGIWVTSSAKNPFLSQSNWIGYIAVATDKGKEALGRRDILVSWRGTLPALEWYEDCNFPLVRAPEIFGKNSNVRVHQGWHSMYTSTNALSRFNKISVRDQVLSEVKKLIEQYKNEVVSITVTGHSLGASMATLNAIDMASNGINQAKGSDKQCPVTAFAYASPRVGDSGFKDLYQSVGSVRVLRVRNMPDIVPQVPPAILYTEVGEELQINSGDSEFLHLAAANVATWHNLEASYLHVLAGTQGVGHGFDNLVVKRDISLANKELDVVKYEYLVPPYWWVLANHGMNQQKNGSWKLLDREGGQKEEEVVVEEEEE